MTGIGEAFLISAGVSLLSAGITQALSPTQKLEAGRLDSLVPNNTSYGATLPWAWGTVRLPGNKIWLDYLEEVKKKSKQGKKGAKIETTNYTYYGYWAEVYAECPFRPAVGFKRQWMNKILAYSTVGGAETIAEGGKFAEQYMRFYLGEPVQEIDPLLQYKQPISSYSYGIPTEKTERDAFLRSFGIDPNTATLTPRYNHRVYAVAQRLPLGDFFNAIPTGEAEIIFSENCTVAQIVGDLFSLFYERDRYDTSLLTTPVDGFTIDSINAAKNAIQTLQQAYFFNIVSSNGVYKFIPLNHPRDVVHLRIEDLAAHTGENKPVDYEIIEADPASMPSKVTVKYIDPDLNYDVNSQDSGLEVKGHYNPNPIQLSFSLVMSASEAATIADRALILAWISKYTYKFKLPPAYLDLEIDDLIANVFDDREYPIRLTKLRLGANLIIDCEGVAHDVFFWNLVRQLETGGVTLGVADYNVILEVSGTPTAVASDTGTIYTEGTDYTVSPQGNIQVLETGNIPAGSSIVVTTAAPPEPEETTLGSIVSAGDTELKVLDIPLIKNSDADYTLYLAASGGENWTGCSVYFSTDNARYLYVDDIQTHSIFGNCVSDWDGNTIDVTVNRPELESITDSDLSLGFNLVLMGDKICQFKTAEAIALNTYRLSRITLGLRGTQTQADPASGDRFVLLTGETAQLTHVIGEANDIGEVRYFKAVSSGQTLSEVTPVQITVQGIAQRPYAPVNLAATKNGVGDIAITWDRRDRHSDKKNPPILSEELEEYALQIVESGNVVRVEVVDNNSYIYTAANQTTDLGSIASTITVKIAQVSSDVGNGSFATARVTPELVEPVPTISSFSPASSIVGPTITVTGTDLASVTAVKIGDINQNNLAVIDNQTIEFRVAQGTVSGSIEVTTTGGTAVSTNALIIEIPQTLEGHVIQDNANSLTQRPNLKFTGNVVVTDDDTAEATIVEVLAPTASTPGTFDELSITTQTLNDGEFEAIDLELPAITALRQIDVSQPTRIRLFGTDSARSADTADINTQLQNASGLILDKLITDNYQFARAVLATNCDDPIANYIYARIGNNSGAANSIDVGIKYYAIA